MALTYTAKQEALNAISSQKKAPTLNCEWLGVYTTALTVTAFKQISFKELEKTAHGLKTGDTVVLSALEGGEGLVNERIFFIEEVSANVVKLLTAPSGELVEWTSEVKSCTLTKVTEASGGTYKRIKAAHALAKLAKAVDATERKIKVPAMTVNWVSIHSAETSGTLMGLFPVTKDVFAAEGEYPVISNTLDLLAEGKAP